MKYLIAILMTISSFQAVAHENIYEVEDLSGGRVRYIKIKKLTEQEIDELINVIFHSDAPLKDKETALQTLIDAGAIEFEVEL